MNYILLCCYNSVNELVVKSERMKINDDKYWNSILYRNVKHDE